MEVGRLQDGLERMVIDQPFDEMVLIWRSVGKSVL